MCYIAENTYIDARKNRNKIITVWGVFFFFPLYTERQFWIKNGKETIAEKLKYANKKGVAKNIIMFLGDGMSLTTLTASRIYKGQMEKRSGESEYLSFEKFPFVGMSKVMIKK